MSINKEDIFYLFVFLFFAAIFFLFAISGYPLLGGDSYAFLPTSIHLSRAEGLINKLYMPTGQKEMLFYPPLFPYFQSVLMFGNKINAIFISLTITSVLTLGVLIVSIRKLFENTQTSFAKLVFVFILLAGISTGLDISSGRPEILLNLLFALAILVFVYKPHMAPIFYGLLVILIGLCSIVSGLYAIFILLLFYVHTKANLRTYLLSIFAGLICFLLFIYFYPYSLYDLIHTMYTEAQKIVFVRDDAFTLTEFVNYHFTYPSYTFYFLLFLLASILVLIKIYKSVIQLTLYLLVFALIYYFGFRNLANNYYVYNLFILYVFVIIYQWKNISTMKYIMLGLFLLLSIGFTRRTFLYFYFYDDQATLLNTEMKLNKYSIVNYRENTSFWPLLYYKNFNKSVYNTNYSIYQQSYGNLDLRKFKNIEVQNTRFESLTFAGLTIANNPPFYYYILVKND